MARHNWDELTRTKLNLLLPDALVVLPTAATEQHGPHLSTGHDVLSVVEIAGRAADIVGNTTTVIVTPALEFGSSDHHLPFGGTLALRTETYLEVVKDLLRSMVSSGAKKMLLLNGHGGNQELNEVAVRDVAREQVDGSGILLAAASYWNIAANAYTSCHELEGVRVPGHAGQFETAMMMAVDMSRVRDTPPQRSVDSSMRTSIPGVRVEGEVPWAHFDGYTDFPDRANVQMGRCVLEITVREVALAMLKLSGARGRTKPDLVS